MSVTISLIPLALAAAGLLTAGTAAHAGDALASRTTRGERAVGLRTRLKDRGLLEHALADIGATDITVGEEVAAAFGDIRIEMAQDDDGIWQAHVTGEHSDGELTERGTELLAELDAAYALRVQQAVAQRIRERADAAGFELASEQREGDTVTMTLTVKDRL
ncbi:hypothetical protein [Microbacterium stercoris]|uniref:DUF1257 domain-containing protein n=1 Tax=Microbacterium stercoris TaxID=2820289 RepID=A0A939TPI7_9MICO|nr:hypothetical protein [Microbacterium stercoris]MBO3662116.1 hypothetical protein [Microbacterium stercoris]